MTNDAMQVREELQRFLEDDDDMAKMCLTRKKELERLASAGAPLRCPACPNASAATVLSCFFLSSHSRLLVSCN